MKVLLFLLLNCWYTIYAQIKIYTLENIIEVKFSEDYKVNKQYFIDLLNDKKYQSYNKISLLVKGQIPDELYQLDWIKSFRICGDSTTKLTSQLNNLINLNTIEIYGKIKSIDKNIYLPKLDTFCIGWNNINKFPKAILNCKSITYLEITRTSIKKIPKEINELTELKSFIMDFDNLKKIPEELYEIRSLKGLNLQGNHIKKISDNICKLTSLESLCLLLNEITYIPKCLYEIKNLKYIYTGIEEYDLIRD